MLEKRNWRARLGSRGRIAAFMLVVVAAGCAETSLPGRPALSIREETAEMRVVPDRAAWVNAPQALITVERSLGSEREQKLALPNPTSMRGDNYILLRARVPDGADMPRFRLQEFLDRVGGPPAPFPDVTDGNLRSRDDALGTFFWVEKRFGVDTICVLALRRTTSAGRPLPRGVNALDVMLRNCVRGTVDDALAPIGAATIGYPGAAAPGPQGSGIRSLSPLAAPMP